MSRALREMMIVVPAGAMTVEVVQWPRTDPDAAVIATLHGDHDNSRITVRTTVRTGIRLSADGSTYGIATDAATLASVAVWDALASKLPPIERDDQRGAARAPRKRWRGTRNPQLPSYTT